MKPQALRVLDLSRPRKNILIRLVTDYGGIDLSLPRFQAATVGAALTEYAAR